MGKEPSNLEPFPQTSVEVLPTRTIYTFSSDAVRLTLTFMTAALPDDIDVLSRPVTYVTWEAVALDRNTHQVAVHFDALPEIAMNNTSSELETSRPNIPGLDVLAVGTVEQPVLQKKGDDLRIDWGHFYIATPAHQTAPAPQAGAKQSTWIQADGRASLDFWIRDGTVPPSALPGRVSPDEPQTAPPWRPYRAAHALSASWSLGPVSSKPVSRFLILAYDDQFSIQYMKKNLRPYWRRNGDDAAALLTKAAAQYESLKKRCESFDAELMKDLRKAGGEKYARLGALAFRQCFAAGKFVADANGQPLQFCKENHSNGCIGTSDVFYPMAPQFLLFGPSLAKSFLVPFMNYAASDRWKFPFAPHDLGTYPQANGQVYGDGERGMNNQMPVEESGNLLILFGAIAQMEGNADFAGLYWKQLEQWAQYLKEKGFDPENQLCTDDFAGHLAHNVNLSVKAICGLGSFAKLCALRGDKSKAREYFELARGFAQRWNKEAAEADHYRLAFDRPGSWSQKYNLVWDRILDLDLFPSEIARREMDYYKKTQNRYGLALDNRKDYTKLDWITWTATLTRNQSDFEALINPVYTFLNETPNRSPMTDWYDTKTGKKVGFTARPVVGGVFLQMLYDKTVWKKWASRDKTKAANWAPMPAPPKIVTIMPAADQQPATWRYTVSRPTDGWEQPGFDDSTWKEGKSGFGTSGTPGAVVGTTWNTPDIWLRREVDISPEQLKDLQLWMHHDEDIVVFVNGSAVARAEGWTTGYDVLPLRDSATAAFKPGRNLIGIHCHQTGGGQFVDLGLVRLQNN
jgi:hypothetical protein